ncbi:MAG TPA: DNA polymerase III subunit alpha [Acidobacteriaceae bacterium]|jgi:DNA polymerase-3 subunit alpha|nr:DNA polymerase III subunit alpha [Acidobacteriaceae bacterium]
MAEFTHLHLHTDYSLLDGACDIEKLVAHVKGMGQKAVAMTDHGNIYGAVHLFDAAKKHDIKPILGCELYVCKKEDHRADPQGDEYNHLLVIAENEEGYRNLVRITSEASLHGFYRKPRISKRFLAEHAKGLIGFSGCLAGELCQYLMQDNYDSARATAKQYEDIFGRGNFFLEIQDQGLEQEKKIHADLFRLEKDLGIPLVATNDSHYINHDDHHAHDVLLCVQTGASVHDAKRFRFDGDQFYVKTAEEMEQVFSHNPEVVARTMQFVERCNMKINKVANSFPQFDVPPGFTIDSYFEKVSREGFRHRLETSVQHLRNAGHLRHTTEEYEQRLQREIDCIQQMKFSGYFLIVWDFIRYAKEQDIPVGPGRGSATGSLVSYAMGITDIDPLQASLLFERFLNPERVSMPDIDIDFCMNRRGEVIDYVTRKYGREQVAQIITFNTMAAKAAVKDVGRALDMPYGEVDKIAKLIPPTIGITLDKAIAESQPLQQLYEADPQIRELLDTARRLEGLARGAGVHAAGVVIAPEPLTNLVPLSRSKNEEIVTAYDMKAIEKIGLLKMDFLGLTALTVIHEALRLIGVNRGVKVDMDTIPLEDKQTYAQVFHRALTSGVFQFESDGMRDVLRRYKPETVADLTALNALYRPGPMAMIDDFVERKWGRKEVQYELPELETLLKETLGVIVYQEQVMQIANVLAGYSLGEADLLRRAMGKKDPVEMAKQRDRFVQGALERKFPQKTIAHIFDQMERFAGYGFNKSHSAAYALLAYHTAYLKTHYPMEFMSALLTSEVSKPENVVKYIKECREMGIAVEPPDVLTSDADFTPNGNGIRFGLAAIKNVGRNAIESILAARKKAQQENLPFTSLFDFCERIDLRLLNKRVLESLIKSGAFDCFGQRAALAAAVDKAMERAQKSQRDHAAGQHGLFGLFNDGPVAAANSHDALPQVPEWEESMRLQNEKEVLGFYVSGHPMDKYAEKLRNLPGVIDTQRALEMTPAPNTGRRDAQTENEISVAGILTGVRVAKSRRGDLYAQGTLEDLSGKIDIMCFPEAYKKLAEKLKMEVPVIARGILRGEEDAAPKLAVNSISALEDVKVKLPGSLRIRVAMDRATELTLAQLHALIVATPGPGKLLLDLEQKDDFLVVLEPAGFTVAADKAFVERVEELMGQGAVRVIE